MRGVDKKYLPWLFICLVASAVFIDSKPNSEDRKDSSPKMVEVVRSYIVPITTTTIQVIEEETTTTTTSVVEETTTTTVSSKFRPVPTIPYVRQEPLIDGPPHDLTSLVGCISYYESSWGADPNVFQFIQSTWEAYGGVGSPSNAPYWRQEQIFWLAWNDAGPHHWAAQKGRCF